MDLGELIEYCVKFKASTEDFPFDEVTLTYKVGGKIFILIPTDSEELRINLKCNPEKAIQLREEHPAIIPGFHMNKKHWNTVILDGSLSRKLLHELIKHSYELVYESLTKAKREEISNMEE